MASIIPIRTKQFPKVRAIASGAGFIDGFAEFDPLFFNLTPRETMSIDPQERLFLQACWEAMEDAGYTRDALARRHGRRVGVFAGITKTGYDLYIPEVWRQTKMLPQNIVQLGGESRLLLSRSTRAEPADRYDVLGVVDGDP